MRKHPVTGWRDDPNLDLPATPEEVAEADEMEMERLMQEPPLGIDPKGMIRGRRR